MAVPAFTIDGVLPPFVGPNGPGGAASDMTPYTATLVEVVDRFGTTDHRRAILRDWLQHRQEMRGHGIEAGFQWVDGSFVEDKIPGDIDVVTFFRRPAHSPTVTHIRALFMLNPDVFKKSVVKQRIKVDAMFVDLDASPEAVVEGTRYYGGLFSHRREDSLWKGMVRVSLDAAEDAIALAMLDQLDAPVAVDNGHEEADIHVQGELP